MQYGGAVLIVGLPGRTTKPNAVLLDKDSWLTISDGFKSSKLAKMLGYCK